MKYLADIQSAAQDPERLEQLYQLSRQANDEAEFRADLQSEFASAPENILFSAWHARFDHQPLLKARRVIQWGLAIGLGIIAGLILWALSDPSLLFNGQVPLFVFLWAPIATIPALIYLVVVSRKNYLFAGLASIVLILACVYIQFLAPAMQLQPRSDYINLMLILLPLLCWIAIGVTTLKFSAATPERFAFLVKSIEVMVAAAVYLGFGVAFGLITTGLFSALNVTIPEPLIRLVALGGVGLISILAIATMYDPHLSPRSQDFSQGLTRFIFTILRLLLPLTFLVLLIYIFVIPFNFMAPFNNRDILIIYNVMQFAIIGLLIGVTPLELNDLSPKLQAWLRRGVIAVAILAIIISLYALSAVTTRTAVNGFTLNRLTIIGWNVINIAILVALAYSQLRESSADWHARLQAVFSKATTAYLAWSVLLVIVLPLIFK